MDSIIQRPISQMRESPSEKGKVVSQAIFAEKIQIQKRTGKWALIKTSDGYLGWAKQTDFCAQNGPYEADFEVSRIQAHLYLHPDLEFGPFLTLPFGSQLKYLDEIDDRWIKVLLPNGKKAHIQKGDVEVESLDLLSFSKKFLGIPYTWGGRSSFGFDCSGFVQMLYRHFFCLLPRDAQEQFQDPRGKRISMNELSQGDLIFWGFSEDEIKHVGLYLGNTEFIHTSSRENKPYLRISQLDDFEWSGQGFYKFKGFRKFSEQEPRKKSSQQQF